MSTERRKKKPRNEKIWICVAVCVVAALLIFAIVKMIAKKKPQNGGNDLSSVSSVSVESGGQSAETSSEISEKGQPSDGESSAAESSEQADSKAPSSSSAVPLPRRCKYRSCRERFCRNGRLDAQTCKCGSSAARGLCPAVGHVH